MIKMTYRAPVATGDAANVNIAERDGGIHSNIRDDRQVVAVATITSIRGVM